MLCNNSYKYDVLNVLGVNYIETEELSSGQEHLEKSLKSLEDYRLTALGCNIVQNALNQMGILWSTRREWIKAKEFLQASEKLYAEYKQEVGTSPYTLRDVFALGQQQEDLASVMKSRTQNFEDTFTHTTYYMAQVLTHVDETDKSAEYCHITLQRQLQSDSLDHIDWAMNAATLSQFYITQNSYDVA